MNGLPKLVLALDSGYRREELESSLVLLCEHMSVLALIAIAVNAPECVLLHSDRRDVPSVTRAVKELGHGEYERERAEYT